MSSSSYEARINLALDAIQNGPKLSIKAAVKHYDVRRTTLQDQLAGQPTRRDTTPNSRRLISSEDQAIVEYMLELYIYAFLLRLSGIEDTANCHDLTTCCGRHTTLLTHENPQRKSIRVSMD